MFIKVGHVSYNSRTQQVKFDRRHIKGKPVTKHLLYIGLGLVATAGVSAVVKRLSR